MVDFLLNRSYGRDSRRRSMVRRYSKRRNTGMERRAGGQRQMEKENKGAYEGRADRA